MRNLKRRTARAKIRDKHASSIYAAAFLLLRTSEDGEFLGPDYRTQVTAADIAEELQVMNPELGVTIADVRWSMAQPEAQKWFTKVKIKSVALVGWEWKK
mgnify:CR=1 FL=1|jgi:hypothetical protein|tara:strand:- start:3104 stop:3403 length:300 start_codon:yes stop_codon:yes gene_type:complete